MLAAVVVAAVPIPGALGNKLPPGSEPNGAADDVGASLGLGCDPRPEKRPGPPPAAVVPIDELCPVAGALKRLGVAGFAALSVGLAPPKKLPPRVFVPVDVGAAGVLPPTAGAPVPPVGAVAPPKKLPPVGPPGPKLKMPPPAVAGFGAANPKLVAPVLPAFVPAVLPKRFPVAIAEVPVFGPAFPKSGPPVGVPEGAIGVAGFKANNPEPPNALPALAPAPAGFGAFAFPPPKTPAPIPEKPPLVPGAPLLPPNAPPAPAPPNAVLLVVFAPRLPKRPPVAAGVGPEVEGF